MVPHTRRTLMGEERRLETSMDKDDGECSFEVPSSIFKPLSLHKLHWHIFWVFEFQGTVTCVQFLM
jgi:hypothetical protein